MPFSKNAEELQTHVLRYPEIGQSHPFSPDVGDPFGIELARLLANFLASVKSLVPGQQSVLCDIWPKVEGQLSEFERGEYTRKRLAVFEADEAKLLEDLRNYSQHKFLPYLSPAWQFSQAMPMAEFQFRLHIEPLLRWDSLNAEVREYLEQQGDSIDLTPSMAENLDAAISAACRKADWSFAGLPDQRGVRLYPTADVAETNTAGYR
jgi:hypothetical protein